MNYVAEIDAALKSTGEIHSSDYLRWATEGDLSSRARLYELTRTGWSRIQPEPEFADHSEFVVDYLMECLVTNPEEDDYVHGGFTAGHELAVWVKHLINTGQDRGAVERVAQALASAYKTGDGTTRNRIETGFLEHALEARAVRPSFAFWAADPVLQEGHRLSLEWGVAHEDSETDSR